MMWNGFTPISTSRIHLNIVVNGIIGVPIIILLLFKIFNSDRVLYFKKKNLIPILGSILVLGFWFRFHLVKFNFQVENETFNLDVEFVSGRLKVLYWLRFGSDSGSNTPGFKAWQCLFSHKNWVMIFVGLATAFGLKYRWYDMTSHCSCLRQIFIQMKLKLYRMHDENKLYMDGLISVVFKIVLSDFVVSIVPWRKKED